MVPRLSKIQADDEKLNRIQDQLLRVVNPALARLSDRAVPADSTATTVADLRRDFNALLALLREAIG